MRIVNRVLALIVGVAVIALAVVVTTEVVRSNLGLPRWFLPYQSLGALLTELTWDSDAVKLICAAVAVIGLVLVIAQLWPRRRRFLQLSGAADGIDPVLPRSSLRKAIDSAAAAEEGVRATAVKLGPRRAVVRLLTTGAGHSDDDEVANRVAARVTRRIADIGPARQPRITVHVVSGEDR
jgi:hypothetical protein